jgi:hypothetical protein
MMVQSLHRDAWRDYTRVRLSDAQFQVIYALLRDNPLLAPSMGYKMNPGMLPWDFQRVNHIQIVSEVIE